MRVGLRHNQRHLTVNLRREGDLFRVSDGTTEKTVRVVFLDDRTLLIELEGKQHQVDVARDASSFHVAVGGHAFTFIEERAASSGQLIGSIAAPEIIAPMPGKVVHVFVKPGDQVASGDTLFIVEAMKMESRLIAEASGMVKSVNVGDGDLVDGGQVLAVLAYVGDNDAHSAST